MQALDREIARLALPALGALAAEPLYVLVDTAIVGRLGTPELAGLAVATTLILTGYSLFIFLAYGTTSTVARLRGAGEAERATAQGVQGLWLAVGIGLALAAGGLVFGGNLVDGLGADGEVRRHALTYFRISMAGVPALTLVLAGTGYLRGHLDTRTPLVVAVGSAVGNLMLEIVFVFGFDWGMAGSAWATVIAQVGAASVYVFVIARDVRADGVSIRPDRRALAALSRISANLFLRTAALRLALIVGVAVAARIGTVEVAAHQIAWEIWAFLAIVLDSLAIAAQAMIGHDLGAGHAERARATSRRLLQWGIAGGLAFAVAVVGLRHALPGIFSDDVRVTDLATFLLLFVGMFQPVNAVVFVLDGVLIGAGDMRFLAWAMAVAAVAFVPTALAVLVLDLGIGWLWAAYGLLQLVRLIVLAARWRTPRWQVLGAG